MDVLTILLLSLVCLLIGLLALLWWHQMQVRSQETTVNQLFLSRMAATALDGQREHTKIMEQQAQLLDKAIGLLATKDPLAFQQVQVMGTPSGYDDADTFDPSEEAELERIAARNQDLAEQGDGVNAFEESLLADAGIDPAAFYGVSDSNSPAL